MVLYSHGIFPSYQAVQATTGRSGRKFFGVVGAEASTERVRDTAGGSAHSRRLRLSTTLENLQLHGEDVFSESYRAIELLRGEERKTQPSFGMMGTCYSQKP